MRLIQAPSNFAADDAFEIWKNTHDRLTYVTWFTNLTLKNEVPRKLTRITGVNPISLGGFQSKPANGFIFSMFLLSWYVSHSYWTSHLFWGLIFTRVIVSNLVVQFVFKRPWITLSVGLHGLNKLSLIKIILIKTIFAIQRWTSVCFCYYSFRNTILWPAEMNPKFHIVF